jgi:hypothetical protein
MRALLLPVAVAGLGCGCDAGSVNVGDAAADAGGDGGAADGRPDGAPGDGPAGDRGSTDTAGADAGACNAAAVAFPRGGLLAPGTLCDDVFACADDAAAVARIQAASGLFQCMPSPVPESTCTAFACAYRNPRGPTILDEAEIAEICRVTLVTPAPRMVCVVYD